MQFDLQNFLPYRLSLLTNTISQGMAHQYRAEHDISIIEWRILAVLGRFPGLTATRIVERTAMDKVTVSRAVKSLMAKGLVRRQTDRGDRRRRQLFVTPGSGQKVLQHIVPRAQRYEQRLLRALSPDEAAVLDRSIGKLQRVAESQHSE